MDKEKDRKIRVSLHKNRSKKRRERDWTRQYHQGDEATEDAGQAERIRAKGDLSRKRTVIVGADEALAIPESECRRGRVVTVQGLYCAVATDDGQIHRCYIRRLLKSLETEARSVVATGDWVWFKPAPDDEGMIVRVENRSHLLTRGYRHKEQVIAANVDCALIVGSLVDPSIKPNLIDRYLVSAHSGGLRPIICLNKVDLAEAYLIQPLVGLYSQLGYVVVLTSARTGQGISELREALRGRDCVVVGQSGVGKSSILNALEPSLHLKVGDISGYSGKGKHTTTNSQLLHLSHGGTVIDTPGVRQFELFDVEPGEVEAYFVELRPFAALCRFPGCTHRHEDECAVKEAVDFDFISAGRYESYLRLVGA